MKRPANALRSILRAGDSSLAILAIVALLASVLGACDSDLQKQLDDKRETRYKAAADAVAAIEAERIAELTKSLPAVDAKPDGNKPAILKWRASLFATKADAAKGATAEPARDDAERLELIMKDRKLGQGTPAEEAARYGLGFVSAARENWAGKDNMERYSKFLDGYISESVRMGAEARAAGDEEWVQRPFLAEAEFDRLFLYASRHYVMAQLPLNARLLATFGSWQIAFNLPSRGRERFSDYVTRVCRVGKLAKHCTGVPHEVRPLAINKPYLEWQKDRAVKLLETKPPQVFADVTQRYMKELDRQLADAPDFTEDPVLPSTFSDRAASSGLMLKMSEKKGVRLHTTEVSDSFSGKVPKGLKKAGAEVIQTLKDTPGNRVDFERVVLEMPGEVAGGQVLAALRAFPRDIVRQFDLVGRRRADESLKRTGVLIRLQAADEPDTTSYQFAGAKKKTKCDYIGVAGKPAIGRRSPGSYLVWEKNRIRAAKLTRDPETRKLSVGESYTLDIKPSQTKELHAWIDANPGIIRLFLTDDFSYDELLQALSSVSYKCHDLEIAVDEFGREKKTFTCGTSEARDVTLPVGICR
jgi:hypothetical protein